MANRSKEVNKLINTIFDIGYLAVVTCDDGEPMICYTKLETKKFIDSVDSDIRITILNNKTGNIIPGSCFVTMQNDGVEQIVDYIPDTTIGNIVERHCLKAA